MFNTQFEQYVATSLRLYSVVYEVETNTLYTFAPLTLLQSRLTGMETLVDPLLGLYKVGVVRACALSGTQKDPINTITMTIKTERITASDQNDYYIWVVFTFQSKTLPSPTFFVKRIIHLLQKTKRPRFLIAIIGGRFRLTDWVPNPPTPDPLPPRLDSPPSLL